MIEREDIIEELIGRLVLHDSDPVVTRDLKKLVRCDNFPTIVVVELKDDVRKPHSRERISYDRDWNVSLVSHIQGTTGEKAAGEMALFQQELKRCIYSDGMGGVGQYGAHFLEVATSGIVPLKAGNNAIAQEIVLRVMYREEIDRNFN